MSNRSKSVCVLKEINEVREIIQVLKGLEGLCNFLGNILLSNFPIPKIPYGHSIGI